MVQNVKKIVGERTTVNFALQNLLYIQKNIGNNMRLIFINLVVILQLKVLLSLDYDKIIQQKAIKVIGQSKDHSFDQRFQKTIFTIQGEDKNKKKAYNEIIQRFQLVQKYFKKHSLVPQQGLFYSKKIQTRMNKKRKIWIFKRVVTLLTEISEEKFVEKSLRKFGIKNYRHVQIVKGILSNQKQLVMKAFRNAKQKARRILDEIGYHIKKVKNVEVLGNTLKYEEKIEDEIQKEYNENEQVNDEQQYQKQSTEVEERSIYSEISEQNFDFEDEKNIEVEVIFQIGEQQDNSSQQL